MFSKDSTVPKRVWLPLVEARPLLRQLVALPLAQKFGSGAPELLSQWLSQQGLGALGHRCFVNEWPALAACLQTELYATLAQNSLHSTSLQMIVSHFQPNLPLVLLKGMALAESVYEGQAYRSMSDIDIWVPAKRMEQAVACMAEAGFASYSKERRPFSLQMQSNGEIQFYQPQWVQGLVELHLSPFPGWWIKHTADIDLDAIWARLEPLTKQPLTYQLAPEDTVIHLAVHTAINHQFDLAFTRSLVDIALTAQKRSVDWGIVAQRAKAWRVATAVFTVLSLLDTIIGLPEMAPALAALQPPRWQGFLLQRLIPPEAALNGSDSFSSSLRFLILLLLVDRNRDRANLIWRTLWPSAEWLEARYGRPTSHWAHLWGMVRRRDV